MPNLKALRSDSASQLGALMRDFRPGADRDALLAQHDAIALHLLIIAVATLLVDGASQKFFLNLVRAAENGRRLLALFRRRGLEPPPASRNMPLLAALAAGDFARADAIAGLSRDARAEVDSEYEDEFLWARTLQLLARVQGGAGPPIEPVLARLTEVSPELHGDRVAIARALLARNAAGFTDAFRSAQLGYEQQIEKRARSFAAPITSLAPHRFLWLEGLALLRLAERAGVAPPDEYRYCPRLARVPMTAAYAGDWAVATGAD